MSNLVVRILSFLLGIIGNSPIVKIIVALLTGSSIYAKDAYYLRKIDTLSEGASFSIIGDFLNTSLNAYAPIFIIALEVGILFLCKKNEGNFIKSSVKQVPLFIIILLTFEKYWFPKWNYVMDVSTILWFFICIGLIVAVYILHELFLHTLKDSIHYFKCFKIKIYRIIVLTNNKYKEIMSYFLDAHTQLLGYGVVLLTSKRTSYTLTPLLILGFMLII